MSDSGAPLRYEELEWLVDPGQSALRIDRFLSDRMPSISRSRIQQAASEGLLRVNGKQVKSNYKVRPGDEVQMSLPRFHENFELTPEDIPLDIRYEDEHVLVIDKPAGLVVHPGPGNWSGTLANALLHHFGGELKEGLDPERLGIIHRLDKDTSGLMVIGKTASAAEHLSQQFFVRSAKRRYKALVWGEFEEQEGRIEGHIGRDQRHRLLFRVYEDGRDGKHAVTHYRVLENLAYVALIECRLETGRTHQIRVHLKHIGHTLFGDPSYGGNQILKGTIFSKYRRFVEKNFSLLPRQALHAAHLGFQHPKRDEFLEFESDLPEDFVQVLERWRRYVGALRSPGS
jgi:23S rRNA pseudouridine1911/1915/1917 synthase